MAGWREILKEKEKQNTSSSVSSTPSSGGGSTFKPSTFNVKTATPDEWGQALQHITSKLGITKSSTPVTSTPSFAQQYKTVLDNTANVLTKGASGKYTSAEDYSKLSSQIAGLQLMTFADEQENKGKGTQESEAYYRGLREYLAGVQNETVKQKDYYGSFKDEDEYKSTIFADRTPRIEPSKQFTELTIKNPNIEKELTKGGNALIGGGSPLSQMYTAQYTQQLGTLKEYKTDDGYKTIAPRSMPTADDKRDIGASFDLLGADGTIKKNPYVVDKELEQDIWKAQNPYLEFLKQKNVNKTLGLYPLMPAGTPDSSKYLAERQLALIDDEIGKLTELDASKEGSLQKAKADLYNHHTYATTMDKDAFDTKAAVLQSRIGRLDDRLKLLEADKYRLEQEIQGYDMEIKQRSLGKKYAQYSQMSDFDELSKYAGYYDNNYKFTVTPKRLTDSSNADAQLQSIAQDLRNREGDSTLLDALDFIKQYEAKQKNVNILSEKDINNLLFMRAEAEVNGHKQQVDEINKKLGDYQYRQLPQGYIPELVSAPLVIYNPSSQAKREAEEADERDKYEAALRLVKEFREAINEDITGTPEQKNQYKILNTYWQTGEYIDPTQQHYSQGGSKDSDIVRRYGEMTPDEQAIYNYLYNTDGAQAAQKYLDDYADILGMRGAVKVAQEAAEKAEQYPVLSGVAGGLYKLSLANEIMSLIEMGNQAVHGMNPYSPVYDSKIKYDTFNSAAAQRMDELLTDKDGNTLMIPYLNKSVGSTLYNVALSVGDSAGRIPLARLFGSTTVPLLLGSSNAAGATMYEAQLRGLDEAQATMLGIAAGVIEFWTEKHSIDTFFDEKGGFWKSLAQQMLAEGSEEGVSYLGNALADAVIAADKSEVAAMQKQMLIENPNLTPSEARRKAREAFVKDGLAEVLAGALSGAVFGTVAGARNVSYERAAGRYMQEATKGNVNTVVEFAKTRMPKGSESQIEAEKISKRGTPGMRKVGKLANMIMTDLDTVMQQEAQTGKDLGSADLLTAWTDIISDTKNAVKNTAEDFLKPTETTIQEVVDKKEMTAQEAKQMRTGYEKAKEHISEADYTDSYTRAYNAGYYGVAENYLNVSEKIGKITNDIAKAAYEAGRQAYAKLAPALKEKAAQERASKLKPGEGRLLLDEGLSKEQLNDEQREQVDIWSNFAKVLGVEAVMFKSDLEQDGIEKVYNGMYDYDSGRIYIDINAGKLKVDDLKRTIVLRTAGHELTHFIKRFSPELFRAYAKAVTDVLIAKGQNIDTLVNNEVARYKSQGIDADMGVALEEVIANASEMMLQDSQAVQKMAEESPTLLQKIADWFKDFAKRVKEAFNRINIVERPETRALMHEVEGGLKYIDGLQEMFDNALIHASGFYDNLTEADTTISKAVKSQGQIQTDFDIDDTDSGTSLYQARFTGTTSAREVLAGAFEDIAVNDTERAMIQKYQKQAEQLDNMEQAILDIRDEISDIEQSPNYDPNEYNDRLIRLRNNAKTLENQIQREDKRLLDMENAAALKAVVKRELAKNKDSWEQKRVKAVEHARAVADRRMERYKGTRARNKYKERIVRNAADLHKWIVNPDGKNKKYVPEVLQGVVAPFLASINETSKRALNGGELTIKDRQFLDRLSTLQRKLGEIAHYQSGVKAAEGEYKNLEGFIDMPDEFSKIVGDLVDSVQKLIDDSANANGEFVLNRMNEAELKALDYTVRVLRSSINKINANLSNMMFEHVDETANSTIIELNQMKRKASTNKYLEKASKFLSWDNALPIYVFERLGEGGKSIFQSFQKGQDRLAHNSKEVIDFTHNTFTEKESRTWGKEIHEVEINGEPVKMTTAHIMSLYLHNKRDQSRGHLYGGGMRVGDFDVGIRTYKDSGHLLTESKVQEITDLLTPRQKQVADALQAYMSNVGGDWGNQVDMVRFGVEHYGEDNYIPIVSDKGHLSARIEGPQGSPLTRLLNMSHTKRLTPNANNRIMIYNVFDVFAAHMADMATYNALALPVLDAIKWINHQNVTKYKSGHKDVESVQDSIRDAYGEQALQYVINFIKDVNGAQTIGEGGFGPRMMRRFAKAAVGANLRVAFLQPVAIARAIDILDARSVMVGVLRNIPKLRKNIAEMETYSGIAIWKQMGFYDVNLSRSLKQMIKRDDSFGEKLSEKSLALAALGDRVTWAAIWAGAKHEVNRSGKYKYESPEFYDAVNAKFTEVIYKTQVVDTMLTKSDYMRNTGPLHKWTALFKSEPTATYNMVASRVWQMQDDIAKGMSVGEAWNKNAQSIAQGFRTFALLVLLTTLVEQIAGALRDDDDYLTFADKLKEDLLNTTLDNINVLGNLPILDVFYQYGKRIYGKLTDNENIWGYETNNIMFDFLQDIEKVVDIAVSYIKTGKGKYGATEYGLIYKAFEFASKASGYPAASAMREVGVLWNNTVGQLYPEYKLKRYADRADKGYSKLVEAIITADEQGEQRLRKLFDDKGISEKDFYSGIRKELKALLENGDITEQQAINMLEDELSNFDEYKPQNKPYWEVQKWQFKPEGEESFSRYNRFIEAAYTGKELKEAARELLDHGTTAKDIAAQITREFKPQLLELYNAGDMGGFANLQARALTAYEVIGLNRAEQKKNIDGWVKADVLDRYKEGKLSDTQAMAYIKKNVDTSKKQSIKDLPYWQLKAWQEYRAGKIDSMSNYSVYNDFIDSITIGGAVMEKKAKELLDNGATKSNIGAQITSKYKPIYLELYRAGRHDELDRLTEQLLDAYVAAGYKRYEKQKDVRAWRKAKDE